MEYGFLYRLTFPYNTNPPGRYQEISGRLKEWFTRNGIKWGMGALGGSRTVYGDVQGPSEAYLTGVREQFAAWLTSLPMCCSVVLGPTKPIDVLSLLDKDCELTFEVDNLTDQDRREAQEYHAAAQERAQAQTKRARGGA